MENISKKKHIGEVEVEDKTVEAAVKKALLLLKAPKEQVKIKVLAEEQKGLFGMEGAKPAKIRATIISPSQPNKKT
jgi:spoIIIJ-associated protein